MIEFQNVSKIYGKGKNENVVLKNISFKVEKGEIASVRGVSGVGKSTLLSIIAGILSPTAGDVIVDDLTVNKLKSTQATDYRRYKIGILLQNPYLFSRLSVLDNTSLPLLLTGVNKKEAERRSEKLLQEVGLTNCLNREASTLSGGQAQRASLARALSSGAKIILADEPTSDLDKQTAEEIISLIQKIKEERGLTLLFATHDDRILSISDKILNLSDGLLTLQK